MEEVMVSPLLSSALNFLSLGLSVVLLFAVAYLWSSNNNKTAELAKLQEDVKRMKKTVRTLEDKVSLIREPRAVTSVPQVEPFGIDLLEQQETQRITPLAPQALWMNFIEDYNDLAAEMASRVQLKKCERFIRDNKLKILTYGGAMTFRPAIDAKDSSYWAFKCQGDEFAVVPNPMKPYDETLHTHSGLKDLFALNYEDGVYKRYRVKLPALFTQDSIRGWQLKNPGVANLERE